MSAEPSAYDRSVVILKDNRFLQDQAYSNEILKKFYARAAEDSILESQALEKRSDQLDPRIMSIKTAGSLQMSCMLYHYDKKSFTKLKVVGARFSEGEFEVKEGGCMTSKVTKVVPNIASTLLLENFAAPVQKQVLWEGRFRFRVLFQNDKQTHLYGVYSDEEMEILKLIGYLENKRVKEVITQPKFQSLVYFIKKELPLLHTVSKSELLYQALLDLHSTAEFFIQKQSGYNSVIADHEGNFTSESRVPTTPGLQRRTTEINEALGNDSLLEADSVHMAGSLVHPNETVAKKEENKVKSNFAIESKSINPYQSARFSKITPNESKIRVIDQVEPLRNPQDLNFVSMIKQPQTDVNAVLCDEMQNSQFKDSSSISQVPEGATAPNFSRLQPSQIPTSIHPSRIQATTQSRFKKAEQPFTIESQESTLRSELIVKQPLLPKSTQLHPGGDNIQRDLAQSTARQKAKFTKQANPSTLQGDPYGNGNPTQLSDLDWKSRLGDHKGLYFQEGTDTARTGYNPAQSGSDLNSKLLVDFRQPLSVLDDKYEHNGKRCVLFNSLTIPAFLDPEKMVLLLFCRGLVRNKVPGTESETIKVRSNLLKKIPLQSTTKRVLTEFNQHVVAISQKVTIDAYSTEMDFFEVLLTTQDQSTIFGSALLRKEFLEKIDADRVAFAYPIVLDELEARKLNLSQGKGVTAEGATRSSVVFLNLLPGEQSDTNQTEKKAKQVSQYASRIHRSLSTQPGLAYKIDQMLTSSIKNRKIDELRFLLDCPLPQNLMLTVWLLVTKKFKLQKAPVSTGAGGQKMAVFDPMEKLKSAIMQSMYSTKKELGELELNNRVSIHFHRLVRMLEKQGILCNSVEYFAITPTASKLMGEYFKSSINRYKLMEFIFSRIMADYFDMYLGDQTQQTYLTSSVVGHVKRNALFTKGFRGCCRDHILLHTYLTTYCENISKVAHLNSKDFVIWIVDHILSVNIGILRESLGAYHLHFLFTQAMQHKDDPNAQFGWLINVMLHVFILDRIEKLLVERLSVYLDKGGSTTPEQLYTTVLSSSGPFYQEFIKEYLKFESWLAEKRQKKQDTSAIGNFFTSLAKSATEGSSKPGMESMWLIYEQLMQSEELNKVLLKNQQENITVLQLCRLDLKPNRILNLLKSEKKEQTRRIVISIHDILNKDYPQDQFVFNALCGNTEPDLNCKGSIGLDCTEKTFVFTQTSAYAPVLQIQMQVVGDELLYKHNTLIIGTKNLQLRRFQANTVHNLMLEVFSEPRNKIYYIKVSILVQEITTNGDLHLATEREGIPESLKAKYVGQLGFLLMDNFKHPISNFEGLIAKNQQQSYEDLGMDITDSYTGGRFRATTVRGYHLQAHPDGKGLKLSEEELRGELDTFVSSVKVLLFKNQFEMLEDYIIRYFGSDQNSITAAEVVYVLQCVFKIMGVRTHKLEVVSYVESVIKRQISPKLHAFSLLLGVDSLNMVSTAHTAKSKFVDLKRPVVELITYMSIKKNNPSLVYGDRKTLFLVKDFVEKMRLEKYVTNSNYLQIQLKTDSEKSMLSETIRFDRNFAPLVEGAVLSPAVSAKPPAPTTLDDLLASQQFVVATSPSESLRVSKSELRRIFTQVPLVEYIRFCTQSLRV